MNIKNLFMALGLASVVMLPVAAQAGERASGVKLVSKSEMMRKTLPIKAKKRALVEGVSTAALVAGGIVTTIVAVAVISDDNNSNQSAGASS